MEENTRFFLFSLRFPNTDPHIIRRVNIILLYVRGVFISRATPPLAINYSVLNFGRLTSISSRVARAPRATTSSLLAVLVCLYAVLRSSLVTVVSAMVVVVTVVMMLVTTSCIFLVFVILVAFVFTFGHKSHISDINFLY